jgi:protein ImuB
MAPLWLALRLPVLPLDVFARGAEAAAGTSRAGCAVVSQDTRPLVVAADAVATRAGVAAGQPVPVALALAPGIVLRMRDPDGEAALLCELATFLLGFTPQVALAMPDAVLAEVRASLRLFGGLARLRRLVDEGLRARRLTPVVGIAPTPIAALAFARAGHAMPVQDPAALHGCLAPLSLAHFDIDAEVCQTLKTSGVTTFGALAALPRDALARRCGPALPVLCDRALGIAADLRAPYVPPPRFASRLALPAPVHDVEALAFAVNRLVHELCAWLLARGLGASRLDLALAHERHGHAHGGTRVTRLRFAPGTPSRGIAHLNTVLRERLARVALPAPVEAIALACTDTARLAGRDLDLLPGNDRNAIVVPFVDRLRARLGEDSVVTFATRAEHRPEAACVEARSANERGSASAARNQPAVGNAGATTGPIPAANAPARPPRLRHKTQIIASPQEIAARQVQAAPTMLRPLWLCEEPLSLAEAFAQSPWILRDGPERIESGWWDGGDVRRDYFIAQTPAGGLAWIFRDPRSTDAEWRLHGWFA